MQEIKWQHKKYYMTLKSCYYQIEMTNNKYEFFKSDILKCLLNIRDKVNAGREKK